MHDDAHPAPPLENGFAINVHGLSKRFGERTVVDNFEMQVEEGEIYGFLGPNGSGKTTTIRLLCGLLTPDSGDGTCLGYNILTQSRQIKRQVGYMTQKFSLYEDLSIRENLDFVARVYELPDRINAVNDTLRKLNLTGRAEQMAGKLSGGWKQRLALASCIMHRPRLLLLDEPTAGVDPKARREFWDEIHMLASEGLTVLVSTHYMDEAERCQKICYLAYGKLLARGTVAEVIAQSGLSTWTVTGPNHKRMMRLAHDLTVCHGIDMVAPFGATLHISGENGAALEQAIAPYRNDPDLSWSASAPTLEDVFISMMHDAPDNFQ